MPKRSTNQELDFLFFSIPKTALLQLSTGPLLGVLLAEKTVSQTLQAIGKASEEVFRGELLPVLEFPKDKEADLG